MRRWRRLAVPTAAALALCSCSASGTPAVHNARQAGGRTILLSCADSAGQQGRDVTLPVTEGVQGLAGRADPAELLPVTGHWQIAKAFLAVAPDAAPYRTVSIVRPTTALLFYSDPQTWGTITNADRIAHARTSARLPACGRDYSGYTGGILVQAASCVTVRISAPEGKPAVLTIPVGVSGCRETTGHSG
jgi:hypothetical protein